MIGALAALFALIARFFVTFMAIKVVLATLIVVFLPTILNNVFHDITETMMTVATEQMAGLEPSSLTWQFTGLGAYLADCFRLPECLALTLSALATAFALRVLRII